MLPMQTLMASPMRPSPFCPILGIFLAAALLAGCKTAPQPGTFAPRRGDEVVVAGQFVHTGARVVTWVALGGYDAYRVERRFGALDKADWESSRAAVKDLDMPNRFNLRRPGLSEEEIERVRGGVGPYSNALYDGEGQAIEGLGLKDCDLIHTANEVNRVVKWKGKTDVSRWAGKPVRLRFVLKNSDLYAFQFTGD